jgi:hypothetical protein
METGIWFYTFSTAAQVMAALVGLFAVFVVYKIQDFSQVLGEARSALSSIIPYFSANTKGYELITVQDFVHLSDKEILQTFAELLALKSFTSSNYYTTIGRISFSLDDTTYDYFARLVNKKSRILRRLLIVLILCLSAIALSLIALMLTAYLITLGWFIWIACLLFLYCLWAIGSGVYEITIE